MKQTSKDKIIQQSLTEKVNKARQLKKNNCFQESIEMYHRAIFLKEDPLYLVELAQIYQLIFDNASALTFYKRANQLHGNELLKQKIRDIVLIQGLQRLEIGSIRNILNETSFEPFIKKYPIFHSKLYKKASDTTTQFAQNLMSCLAFLQMNYRQMALQQIEICISIVKEDVDLIVMKALIQWSMMETSLGYKTFWKAYKINKKHNQVALFLQMVVPEVQSLYKQAKFDLIEKKMDKCKLKVKKALQLHPYHTQFLILSAFIHRSNQQYKQALSDLQNANQYLENLSFQDTLRQQISLTYNEMGIFLFKQQKYSQALSLFTQGLTFKPHDWGILANRGDCYQSLQQTQNALKDYIAAYQLQKKNNELCFRISNIYNSEGINYFNARQFDKALTSFEQSLKYSPKYGQFHLNKAKCLLQLQRKQQGVLALQQALKYDPTSTDAQLLLQSNKSKQDIKAKSQRKVIQLSKQKY